MPAKGQAGLEQDVWSGLRGKHVLERFVLRIPELLAKLSLVVWCEQNHHGLSLCEGTVKNLTDVRCRLFRAHRRLGEFERLQTDCVEIVIKGISRRGVSSVHYPYHASINVHNQGVHLVSTGLRRRSRRFSEVLIRDVLPSLGSVKVKGSHIARCTSGSRSP